MADRIVLVLGASGFVGSRCVAKLLENGYMVRAAAWHLDKLKAQPFSGHANVSLVAVNILDKDRLRQVCEGCSDAFYFVHSMNPYHEDFVKADRLAAQNLSFVAGHANLNRIIYLGGLGEHGMLLSPHLRSRMEVSQILHAGDVPVTTLRAAMIIGKGGMAFEILRRLVHKLPVIFTPPWIYTESQPIALDNVLTYLLGVLEKEETKGQVYDIGGPEIVTYRQLMDMYAQEAQLPSRWIIPFGVPLSWFKWPIVQYLTSYKAYVLGPLAEGLKNRLVCYDQRILDIIPQQLMDCRASIRAVLKEAGGF